MNTTKITIPNNVMQVFQLILFLDGSPDLGGLL
jgi:hypothetical protein